LALSASAFLDISDRKHAEAALRAREERFRLAAEAVNEIIYDFDFISQLVERTCGLEKDVLHSYRVNYLRSEATTDRASQCSFGSFDFRTRLI
jgi:PAS domain-containing protein